MLKISGIVESISTRKDKTLKLTIGTNEMSPADAADVFQLNQQFCYLGIKVEPFQKEEQDLIDSMKSDYEGKTPSQRLRGVLYRNWELNNEGYNNFNSYYVTKMELIVTHYKNKLDEESY